MKIHEMLVTELVTNGEFRSAFLVYARERVGVFAERPIAEWPLETTGDAEPAPKPDAPEWRILDANEIILEGDQWAPLHDPERWRPVGDSVGQRASRYTKSRFRRLASVPATPAPELEFVDEPIPETPAAIAIPPAPPDGLQFASVIHPGGAIRYVVGAPGTTHHYEDVVRRPDGSIASARIAGIPVEAGEGFRILEHDEAVLFGDECRAFGSGWRAYSSPVSGIHPHRRSASLDWDSPIHRRALRYSVYWSPVVANDTPVNPEPEPVDADARRRREWRVLEPHEVARRGDRYANPTNHANMVEAYLGQTQRYLGARDLPPVLRRIVTERDGYTAPLGSRILDPEETVPEPSLRNSILYDGFPQAGERVGNRIIFLLDVVEVPNA